MNNTNINDTVRIAKFIANSGYCSRRDAEELIFQGKVSVNGEIIYTPAFKVPYNSEVLVDGEKIFFNSNNEIYLYHKPKGLIVSKNDEKQRTTIFDQLPNNLQGFFSVGRLDKDSSGLLLLTNNGDISRFLELPKNNIPRKYQVVINGKLAGDQLMLIRKGLRIRNFYYKPMKIYTKKSKKNISIYECSITEGKNREIRKVFKYFNLNVLDLFRTNYGPYSIGNLKPSEYIKSDISLLDFPNIRS
tara:strand:+ start:440 stop:1174 length:735 start_codon:yes stop_codon:yes gene_type:complete